MANLCKYWVDIRYVGEKHEKAANAESIVKTSQNIETESNKLETKRNTLVNRYGSQ